MRLTPLQQARFDRFSARWADPIQRQKLLLAMRLSRTPTYWAKTKAAYRRPESREKISKSLARRWATGQAYVPEFGQRTRINSAKGGTFLTRSSYETKFVELLEADATVLRFFYEPLQITYLLDGVERVYTPDFLVEYVDGVELVEVKPKYKLSTPKNAAKLAAAATRFYVRVVTEDDLFDGKQPRYPKARTCNSH